MEEKELEETIEDCRTQLRAVEEAKQNASEGEFSSLEKVQEDLQELMEITESQLVDIKKAKLLDRIQNETQATTSTNEDEGADFEELLEQIVGMRCRAPFMPEKNARLGSIKYHNAVIMEICEFDKVDSMEDLEVKVLFCCPLNLKMQPCRFFLDNKCNFEDRCKFSHGETVKFGDLLEYEEPDYESLKPKNLCLAKAEVGELWGLGRVESVSLEEEEVAVEFLDSGEQKARKLVDIVPLDIEEEDLSDRTEVYALTREKSLPEASAQYADWEKHTRGIGSRLLDKMGYVHGKGLGLTSTGMLEPIAVKVLPKGKSLDYCAKRVRKQLAVGEKTTKKPASSLESGIFSFINSKLASSSEVKETKPLKAESSKSLNVQLLQLDGQRRKTESEASRLRSSLKRNATKDPVAAGQIRAKLAKVEEKLRSYSATENSIQREQQGRSKGKKLSVF